MEGKPYLEYGEAPLDIGISKKNFKDKDEKDRELLNAIQLADSGDIDEALEHIKKTNPRDYLLYKQQLKNTLTEDNNIKTRKKYTAPDMSKDNVTLNAKQQQVWDLLQSTPKQRRIIWVTGEYGSGKSFLYNYIKNNHDYGMYDAGQTASLDNIAYGYDEEGVVAWDLPRTFNFHDYGDAIANVIEKFSDFGQSITSKKYNGKTQKVLGHAIVFSNHPPIEQLKHRDIIHIDLSQESDNEINQEQNPSIKKNNLKKEHQFSDSSTSDTEEDEDEPIKARILTYLDQSCYLEHPNKKHSKRFQTIHQLEEYIDKKSLYDTLDSNAQRKIDIWT